MLHPFEMSLTKRRATIQAKINQQRIQECPENLADQYLSKEKGQNNNKEEQKFPASPKPGPVSS